MTSTYDKLLAAMPIDRLAAIVTSGGTLDEYTPDEYIPDVVYPLTMGRAKRLAKFIKRQSGDKYMKCLQMVVRWHGYRNYDHYSEVCWLQESPGVI